MSEVGNPAEREIRERCLELAVKADPERAVERAGEFLAFVKRQSAHLG